MSGVSRNRARPASGRRRRAREGGRPRPYRLGPFQTPIARKSGSSGEGAGGTAVLGGVSGPKPEPAACRAGASTSLFRFPPPIFGGHSRQPQGPQLAGSGRRRGCRRGFPVPSLGCHRAQASRPGGRTGRRCARDGRWVPERGPSAGTCVQRRPVERQPGQQQQQQRERRQSRAVGRGAAPGRVARALTSPARPRRRPGSPASHRPGTSALPAAPAPPTACADRATSWFPAGPARPRARSILPGHFLTPSSPRAAAAAGSGPPPVD